jgi:HipA-like protein
MNRTENVYWCDKFAGLIEETVEGYRFTYDSEYLASPGTKAISETLPKRVEAYTSRQLFSFFFGLLAEGELKRIQCRKLKLDENDHFGRLIKTAHCDTIGAVTVVEVPGG